MIAATPDPLWAGLAAGLAAQGAESARSTAPRAARASIVVDLEVGRVVDDPRAPGYLAWEGPTGELARESLAPEHMCRVWPAHWADYIAAKAGVPPEQRAYLRPHMRTELRAAMAPLSAGKRGSLPPPRRPPGVRWRHAPPARVARLARSRAPAGGLRPREGE